MNRKKPLPPKMRKPPSLTVRAAPGDRRRALISYAGRTDRAALGRSGITSLKREGDGATPIATMHILGGYLRRDRVTALKTAVPLVSIHPAMLWCDAPRHAAYNRPVKTPFTASHETMTRADNLYDICLVLDWNITTRRRNAGSAIFFHLAKPGFAPTEGCIAVTLPVMRRLLALMQRGTVVRVLG